MIVMATIFPKYLLGYKGPWLKKTKEQIDQLVYVGQFYNVKTNCPGVAMSVIIVDVVICTFVVILVDTWSV